MCGIIGYVGQNNNALHVLIDGLKTLEYRGYDSSGVAYVKNKKIEIKKEKGKIIELEKILDLKTETNIGIAHTRWATHGQPNQINSHPHQIGSICIVHNGIIENYEEIKELLVNEGYKFKSDTDTEIACGLIDYFYQTHQHIIKALKCFKGMVRGSYALGIIVDTKLDTIYAIRKDSPLIIAHDKTGNYIASDVPAILKYTNQYILLEENEIAVLSATSKKIYNDNEEEIVKETLTFEGSQESAMKNGYDHFMAKEINEQPGVINKIIHTHLLNNSKLINLSSYDKIDIIGCGSAYHAGLVGKHLIESYGNIPCNVEIASEYRYKKQFLTKNSLVIVISQSGETADTLACLRKVKEEGIQTLAIVNVVGSSIARLADKVIYTDAGIEIAVATTKAYCAQVALLSLLAFQLINDKTLKENIINQFQKLPLLMENLIKSKDYMEIAKNIYQSENIFYLGRGIDYPLIIEGSLKLKEISYIHSEAYSAGELKHGTISLVTQKTPIIALITEEHLAEKTISNIKEVKARGANVIVITTEDLDKNGDYYDKKIVIPKTDCFTQGFLAMIPLQLIAYEIALLRNCDIDKPRNLAKSVTVE